MYEQNEEKIQVRWEKPPLAGDPLTGILRNEKRRVALERQLAQCAEFMVAPGCAVHVPTTLETRARTFREYEPITMGDVGGAWQVMERLRVEGVVMHVAADELPKPSKDATHITLVAISTPRRGILAPGSGICAADFDTPGVAAKPEVATRMDLEGHVIRGTAATAEIPAYDGKRSIEALMKSGKIRPKQKGD